MYFTIKRPLKPNIKKISTFYDTNILNNDQKQIIITK